MTVADYVSSEDDNPFFYILLLKGIITFYVRMIYEFWKQIFLRKTSEDARAFVITKNLW